MANISFYGSHNSALVVEKDGKILSVIEVERFAGYKNGGISQYKVTHNSELILREILLWVEREFGITDFETCYFSNTDVNHNNVLYRMEQNIPAKTRIEMKHHLAHANGVFYQSDFPEALIFSFDGGGNDGKFNIYYATRNTGAVQIDQIMNPVANDNFCHYDLGFPYMVIGHYLNDIKLEPLGDGNLVYPGKIMGLVSYGTINQAWLPHFIDFYRNDPNGNDYVEKIAVLGEKLGVTFTLTNRLSGQVAYDIAATSQRAFEECFLEYALPYMNFYPNLPVCITGGCGLNILLNTRLVNEFHRNVFVGPNPNDCGIALGMMLTVLKPHAAFDATYIGLPIMDRNNLGMYLNDVPQVRLLTHHTDSPTPIYPPHAVTPYTTFVDDLIEGKIVGVIRNMSEHGPRALGNRSILCNPSISNMKDVLNEKVKRREWYRPFAPVVRLEDVNTYFEWDRDARWMSFSPTVRVEWREKLASITHVDYTARVQTVTRDQNEWLYDLLTLVAQKTGVGVLLNTSFNINGKPILTTLHDAFELYNHSYMDCLLIEDYYIRKEGFQTL